MRPAAISGLLAPLCLALALAGCGSDNKSDATVYDTPQDAFEAFAAAAKAEDWHATASMLVPDDQAMLAGTGMLMAGFATMGDESKEKSLNELLSRHGVDLDDKSESSAEDMETAMQEVTAPIKDKPQLIADLMQWISENSDDDEGSPFATLDSLSDVKVDGDQATGTISTEMGDQPIAFRKIDGSWRISLPRERGPGGGGAPPEDTFTIVDPSQPLEELGAGGGTGGVLRIDDHAYALSHAVAYKIEFFDEPATAVLLMTRPLDDSMKQSLRKAIARDGNDDAFFPRGVHLKLTFDEMGEIVSVYAWAENNSISTNTVAAEAAITDDRVTGIAGMLEPGTLAEDSTYQFNVAFDAELLSVP